LYPGHNYGGKPSGEMKDVRQSNSALQVERLEDWYSMMGR